MFRKDMKAFIKAIRKRNNAVIKRMLGQTPAWVSATAKSPPKKDDGTVVKQMRAVFKRLSKYGASFDEETDTRESARQALVTFGLEKYKLLPRTRRAAAQPHAGTGR